MSNNEQDQVKEAIAVVEEEQQQHHPSFLLPPARTVLVEKQKGISAKIHDSIARFLENNNFIPLMVDHDNEKIDVEPGELGCRFEINSGLMASLAVYYRNKKKQNLRVWTCRTSAGSVILIDRMDVFRVEHFINSIEKQ